MPITTSSAAFSTMRATAMGQARHIRECGFTYDVGQTMAGSVISAYRYSITPEIRWQSPVAPWNLGWLK